MSANDIILIIIGILLIIESFIVDTNGILNSIILKVLPFFSGCFILYIVLISNEVITINI